MSEKNEIFKKLLPIDELYALYNQIGETILSFIDIENINWDKQSKYNSIKLLIDLFLIDFDSEKNFYYKRLVITEKTLFTLELFSMLLSNYPGVLSFVDKVEIRYDEEIGRYYTKRNFVQLDYSGLLMLLDSMGIIQFKDHYIYFIDNRILMESTYAKGKSKRKTNLLEFKDQLVLQEQLGNDAEIKAYEYEKNILFQNNIFKAPERISLYDVEAGYDIVSYMTRDSYVPNKFIEVKSCADDSLKFYMSKNEIETAKIKRKQYYLYLLNRKTGEFKIIQDPYKILFETERGNWVVEPHVYKIHLIDR